MSVPVITRIFAYLTMMLGLALPGTCFALYEWEDANSSGDVRALLRVTAAALRNPADEDKNQAGMGGIGRLLFQASQQDQDSGTTKTYKINLYQTYIPASISATQPGAIEGVERSSALDYSYSDNSFTHLAFDQMSARWSRDKLDLILGRQAINLSSTFYFSPNDFFGSFSAQTFYRVYKPGVDALQISMTLSELSLVSYYAVLGYALDSSSSTGWSRSPDSSRTSHLAHMTFVHEDREWGLLTGIVRNNKFVGGSMTGEFFDWLGIRAEGHLMQTDDDTFSRLSVGLEHRWENTLDARFELFYNGSGKSAASEYTTLQMDNFYLARRYTALGFSYELSPLLLGQVVWLSNWDDHSWLISANSVYSLSNESELAFSLAIPNGQRPEGDQIRSEYGAAAYSVVLEWRSYY